MKSLPVIWQIFHVEVPVLKRQTRITSHWSDQKLSLCCSRSGDGGDGGRDANLSRFSGSSSISSADYFGREEVPYHARGGPGIQGREAKYTLVGLDVQFDRVYVLSALSAVRASNG